MLTASIVIYRTPADEVSRIVASLAEVPTIARLYLIDNGPVAQPEFAELHAKVDYRHLDRNIGFGAAHNIAIAETKADWHLIANSDIEVEPAAVETLRAIGDTDPRIGLIAPRITFPDGSIQRLCKLLPHPLDVFIRRFAPGSRWAMRRNERYALADFGYDRPANIPFLSGSFLLVRMAAVREVGGFDSRFFVYGEDLDLCRRIHSRFVTRFEPSVSITHYWRRESHRSLRGTWLAVQGHARYFNKWGWLVDRERDAVNARARRELGLA